MIIMNETQLSIVSKLENIAEREETNADNFLANALRTATEEGRTEILNCEKSLLNQQNISIKITNCIFLAI